jgi:hypothetical protein
LNIISVTQATKFLLASRVPDAKFYRSVLCVKDKRVNFNPKGGNILLLELASFVALDKCGLAGTTIANKNNLSDLNRDEHSRSFHNLSVEQLIIKIVSLGSVESGAACAIRRFVYSP